MSERNNRPDSFESMSPENRPKMTHRKLKSIEPANYAVDTEAYHEHRLAENYHPGLVSSPVTCKRLVKKEHELAPLEAPSAPDLFKPTHGKLKLKIPKITK